MFKQHASEKDHKYANLTAKYHYQESHMPIDTRTLLNDLRTDSLRDQLEVHYQPSRAMI